MTSQIHPLSDGHRPNQAEKSAQLFAPTIPPHATNTGIYDASIHPPAAPSRFSISFLMFTSLVLFIAWAAWFEIDQSVRASGQIIASARTQIIQAVDGGVLADMLVQEGQVVEAGQTLAVLEKNRANASFEESRARVAALQAALVRAHSESQGKSPIFGEALTDYPHYTAMQQGLYQQNQASLKDELTSLDDQLANLKLSLAMAEQELEINQNLFATGDASQMEVMRSQQEVMQAERQISDVKGKISAARNRHLQEAYKEVTKLEAELSSARHKLDERQNVLRHTDITAPVTGVVKHLKLNTLGGVLRTGDELMQISPTQSDMVIEVKVNPVDIGQLALGMPVSIKLDAFDFSIYGSLSGRLRYLSSDTLTEQSEQGNHSYYRAHIHLDENYAEANPKFAHLDLKPGMNASVDIQTDRRTVLHYLTKPITRAFAGAFNER